MELRRRPAVPTQQRACVVARPFAMAAVCAAHEPSATEAAPASELGRAPPDGHHARPLPREDAHEAQCSQRRRRWPKARQGAANREGAAQRAHERSSGYARARGPHSMSAIVMPGRCAVTFDPLAQCRRHIDRQAGGEHRCRGLGCAALVPVHPGRRRVGGWPAPDGAPPQRLRHPIQRHRNASRTAFASAAISRAAAPLGATSHTSLPAATQSANAMRCAMSACSVGNG